MDFDGERGHYGAWRLLCVAPAVLTSAVLVAVVCAFLGRYAGFGLLGWLLVGLVLLARRLSGPPCTSSTDSGCLLERTRRG